MPADLNCQVKTSKALQVSGERLHEMVSVLSSLSGGDSLCSVSVFSILSGYVTQDLPPVS
jgi:hypothetical protein